MVYVTRKERHEKDRTDLENPIAVAQWRKEQKELIRAEVKAELKGEYDATYGVGGSGFRGAHNNLPGSPTKKEDLMSN